MKKMMEKLGLGYLKIDMCPNMCMLYYLEEEVKTKCGVCGHARWKPKKNDCGKRAKHVPFKVL